MRNKTDKIIRNIIIAVICIVVICIAAGMFFRYGGRATGYGQTLIDRELYYPTKLNGIYRYSPEKWKQHILWAFQYDDFTYGEEALYYFRNGNIYKVPYETGKKEKIYDSRDKEQGKLVLEGMFQGNLLVNKQEDYGKSGGYLVLDVESGSVISSLTEEQWMDTSANGNQTIEAAGRVFEQETTEKDSFRYQLYEDGRLVLPEGVSYNGIEILEHSLLLQRGTGKYALYDLKDSRYIELPEAVTMTGYGDYIFYATEDHEICCYDIAEEKEWKLHDGVYVYSMKSDADYLYISCPMNGDGTKCFRIVYNEEGQPEKLELAEEL